MLTYLSSTQIIRMTTKPLTYRKGRSKEVHCTGTIRGRWEQEGNRNPRLNSCLPTDAYSYPVHGKMIEVMKYLTPHALLSGKSHKKNLQPLAHIFYTQIHVHEPQPIYSDHRSHSPFPDTLSALETSFANGSFHAASSAHISAAAPCHERQIESEFMNTAQLPFCTLSAPLSLQVSRQPSTIDDTN